MRNKEFLRCPFFEIGIKNYFYGKELLKIAKAADNAAAEYDIDVLMILPCVDLRYVAEQTSNLKLIASHMDAIHPGRGTAYILPEALAEAGAYGVMLNHCEMPMSLSAIKRSISRAREVELISLVCADTIEQATALALLGPDIVCPEPPERIGTAQCVSMEYVKISTAAIHAVNPQVIVEQAAGIRTPDQVYQFARAGAQGIGSSSGICLAKDPCTILKQMVYSVRKAIDEK